MKIEGHRNLDLPRYEVKANNISIAGKTSSNCASPLEALIAEFAGQIEASRLGDAMRERPRPAMAGSMLGWRTCSALVLLVGAIGVLDLRMLGLRSHPPARRLCRACSPTPIAICGLIVQAMTGALLFAADAGPLSQSTTPSASSFLLILAGLINATLFRLRYGDLVVGCASLDAGQGDGRRPSILTWLGVGALGRMIAYT